MRYHSNKRAREREPRPRPQARPGPAPRLPQTLAASSDLGDPNPRLDREPRSRKPERQGARLFTGSGWTVGSEPEPSRAWHGPRTSNCEHSCKSQARTPPGYHGYCCPRAAWEIQATLDQRKQVAHQEGA